MQYSEFEEKFFNELKKEKGNTVELLEENKKLVLEYLGREDHLTYVQTFVQGFIEVILKANKFKTIETTLKHPLLNLVYEEFKKSVVLIRALQDPFRVQVIKWLITLPLHLTVQDSEGATALMYAARRPDTDFVLDYLLRNTEDDFVNVEDNNGNTAIFYSVGNVPSFKRLLWHKNIDYHHVNSDGDSLLTYACKRNEASTVQTLLIKPDINYEHRNALGKNAAMILVEKNNFELLSLLISKCPTFNVNTQNKFGESMVSLFIKTFNLEIENYRTQGLTDFSIFRDYGRMLRTLVELKCDFNVAIDGDGNTPILYFLLMKDYASCYFLLKYVPTLDLSIKNKYGVSASFLGMTIDENYFVEDVKKYCTVSSLKNLLIKNKTFDFSYVDSYGNNLLIPVVYKDDSCSEDMINQFPADLLRICNQKQENAVIIATKLGKNERLDQLLQKCGSEVVDVIHHQDAKGNTALHYAVLLKDTVAIQRLRSYDADVRIENHDGKSPMTLAEEMKDSNLIQLLQSAPANLIDDTAKNLINIPLKKHKKKENLDQQLDHYIKNYRVTEYQKEYDYLTQNEFVSPYRVFPRIYKIQKFLIESYTFNKGMEASKGILKAFGAFGALVSY